MSATVSVFRVRRRISEQIFVFDIDMVKENYFKVRPIGLPKGYLRNCRGAVYSLLTDGKGPFIWIEESLTPRTIFQAFELADRWARATMGTEFPADWPRDRMLW